MLRLPKHLLSLLRSGGASPNPASTISSLQCHLSAAASISSSHFSIEDYLTTTCGLSRAQALKASAHLSHLRSPSNPDAVIAFLSGLGIPRSDIAAVVAKDPVLLCSKVDGTLAPRVAALRTFGLSVSEIARLAVVSARVLRTRDMADRLRFWIPLFGSFDEFLQAVSTAAFGGGSILYHDIDKVVKPNVAQLLRCGLSVRDLAKVGVSGNWLLVCCPEKLKALVARVEELGIRRDLGRFKYALATVCSITEEKIASRMESLKRILRCSEDLLRVAVVRHPSLLRTSEENLRCTVEFLVDEVGLEPECILLGPALLTFSLKGRLMPRHVVMKTLQDKGLPLRIAYMSLANLSEKDFISRYIDHFKEIVPGLMDVYAAARAGRIPSQP